MTADLLLAFAAGIVTLLNPCILPLLPIVVGSAFQQGRLGPLALGGGLALSFALFGTLLASSGSLLGFDAEALRQGGAVFLMVFGLVLLSPALQMRLTVLLSGLGGRAGDLAGRLPGRGLGGQAVLGSVLGLVWSPCVGPTLGAAVAAAAGGGSLGQTGLTMLAFALGTVVALLGFSYGSAAALSQRRMWLANASRYGKPLFGGVLLLVGGFILSGLDRRLEAVLLDLLPQAWIGFTTRF